MCMESLFSGCIHSALLVGKWWSSLGLQSVDGSLRSLLCSLAKYQWLATLAALNVRINGFCSWLARLATRAYISNAHHLQKTTISQIRLNDNIIHSRHDESNLSRISSASEMCINLLDIRLIQ